MSTNETPKNSYEQLNVDWKLNPEEIRLLNDLKSKNPNEIFSDQNERDRFLTLVNQDFSLYYIWKFWKLNYANGKDQDGNDVFPKMEDENYQLYTSLMEKLWEKPNSIRFMVYNVLAHEWIQQGKFAQAEYLFNDILQAEPNNPKALWNLWYLKAKEWLALHIKWQDSKQAFDRARECFMALWDSDAWNGIWTIEFFADGDYDKIVDAYKKSLELNPNNEQTMCNLAIMYYKAWNFKNAFEQFANVKIMRPQAQSLMQAMLVGINKDIKTKKPDSVELKFSDVSKINNYNWQGENPTIWWSFMVAEDKPRTEKPPVNFISHEKKDWEWARFSPANWGTDIVPFFPGWSDKKRMDDQSKFTFGLG